jgi:hypothetical protein
MTFSGTQLRLYGVKDAHFGIGAVSIDGGAETNVDFYAPTRGGNQLLWTSPVLPSGMHILKLRVVGPNSIAPDAVVIVP